MWILLILEKGDAVLPFNLPLRGDCNCVSIFKKKRSLGRFFFFNSFATYLLDHSLDSIYSFTSRTRLFLYQHPVRVLSFIFNIPALFIQDTMGYISIRRGVSSLLIVAPSLTQALRVSPNSPCTSVCTDSNISQSDPTFFDEQWKDIVCTDTALDSTPQGKKLESCFTCLQNSTYTHGSESDQDWFLC